MSYCRFSSMNWMCDVYVYEDAAGGWTTHVAGNRPLVPPIPDVFSGRASAAMYRWCGAQWDHHRRQTVYPRSWRTPLYHAWLRLAVFWGGVVHMGSLRLIPRRSIGLACDGECFSDPSPGQCADRLEGLRAMGYRVPQYAIDRLRAEAADSW